VVQLIRDRRDQPVPRDAVWAVAVGTADPAQAAAVGDAAYAVGRLEDAATAFARACESTDAEIGARAGSNLGVVLGGLSRFDDEIAAYLHVITRYGDDPAPALREQTANALNDMGYVLGHLGRTADDVAAYQQVITRNGDDPAPALREQTANALNNMGVRLGDLGRSDDEIAAYQQVITRYGDDPAPALRDVVRRMVDGIGSQ